MPENDEHDISAGATAPVETERERFERERLSRRQALKRFGMTSAMATFALFSVDDLARIVGKAMQQRAGDNKVAEQVAQEFQEAGVAFAGSPSTSGPTCSYYTTPARWNCCNNLSYALDVNEAWYLRCLNNPAYTADECKSTLSSKNADAGNAYNNCVWNGNAQNEPSCSCP